MTTTQTPKKVEISKKKFSLRKWWRELGFRHLILIIVSIFALYPVVWILSSAFNAVDTLSGAQLFPRQATTDNFAGLFNNDSTPFARWIWNSYKIAIVASVINLIIASMAAFAFSRFRFKGRRVGLLTLLLVQVFPQFLAFVAILLLIQQIGEVIPSAGLDTHLGLILVYLGGAIGFNTFLIKGFMDSVPGSLDEAAKVDGASSWDVFWRIIFPLARPVLAVIFILTFIGIYSEFLLAATLLRSSEQFTLPLGLRLFVQSEYNAKWGALSAAALIGGGPIIVTFLLVQKQIISGLTQGAVKG
jgi:ABC-type maltose transport system permease subunit